MVTKSDVSVQPLGDVTATVSDPLWQSGNYLHYDNEFFQWKKAYLATKLVLKLNVGVKMGIKLTTQQLK